MNLVAKYLGGFPAAFEAGAGLRFDIVGLRVKAVLDFRNLGALTSVPAAGLVPVFDPTTGLLSVLDFTQLPTSPLNVGSVLNSLETVLPSQATVDIASANTRRVTISGTTTITSFGSRANSERLLHFTGALTLTHDGTKLILPTGANIVTAAGDTCQATSDDAGNWRVRNYQRADGTPVGVSTIGKSVLTAGDGASARQAIGAQAALGFAPVQNGTGVGQSASNALKLGYDGTSRIKATVDATDFGALWTDLVAAGSVAGDGSYGVQRFPSGWAIIGGTTVAQTDANGIIVIAVGLTTAGGIWLPLVGSGDFNSSTAQAVAGNTTSTGFSVKFLNSPNSILRVNWIVVGRWK